jgi:hypothetical protein
MNVGKVVRMYVVEPVKIPVPLARREPQPAEDKRQTVLKRR